MYPHMLESISFLLIDATSTGSTSLIEVVQIHFKEKLSFFAYKEVIPSQLKTKYQKDRYNNWQHVLFYYLYLQLYDSEMLGISCNVRGQTTHIPS